MTATLIGMTGLIGSYLLDELLKDSYYDKTRVLIRRPVGIDHPKLEKKIVDFEDSDSLLVALSNSDVVFCSIGTTQKKVKGDKNAYRKVDHDIPVKLARFSKMTECERFVLVSSIGANSKSSNFYLQLKGEVEDTIKTAGLNNLHIFQPSMLLGKRNEFRAGESIDQAVMKTFSFLIPSRFKPVQASEVAKAMLVASKKKEPGTFIYQYNDIKNLIS